MNVQQMRYLVSAAAGWLDKRRVACPQCRSSNGECISTKKIVTRLVQCPQCQLRYRIPQDRERHYFDFYQTAYTSSLATQCPSDAELGRMLAAGFKGTEKNFSHRIAIVQALGVQPGMSLLDYGASWGYATWQFQAAGFKASGFEISQPRAAYARSKLQLDVCDDPDELPDQAFDCLFSSHVLEHVPSPQTAFDLAKRVLKPGGLFVAFTPNGSEASRQAYPENYDHSWGRLHPLYLSAEFYQHQFADQPMLLASSNYGQPYGLDQLSNWDRIRNRVLDVTGRELLVAVVF